MLCLPCVWDGFYSSLSSSSSSVNNATDGQPPADCGATVDWTCSTVGPSHVVDVLESLNSVGCKVDSKTLNSDAVLKAPSVVIAVAKPEEQEVAFSKPKPVGASSAVNQHQVPWAVLLRSGAVWSVIIDNFCGNWGWYVLLMFLPTYLKDELGFSLSDAGFISEAPYIAGAVCGLFAGLSTDYLLRRFNNSRTTLLKLRKINNTIGLLLPGILFGSLCTRPSASVSVIIMVVIGGTAAFALSGFCSTPLDVAPRYAGVIVGISNMVGTVPGIIGVITTGLILEHTNKNWCLAFGITAVLNVIGTVVFLIFGKADSLAV